MESCFCKTLLKITYTYWKVLLKEDQNIRVPFKKSWTDQRLYKKCKYWINKKPDLQNQLSVILVKREKQNVRAAEKSDKAGVAVTADNWNVKNT